MGAFSRYVKGGGGLQTSPDPLPPLGEDMKKVLIVGGGGREHALAWKVAQSAEVGTVFVAPGNAGTAREPKVRNVKLAVDDIASLSRFARDERVDLTIVGPELPLVEGIVDDFQGNGMRCFGPSRAAARLEGSKAFAKDFMARHGIPTAASQSFTDARLAADYIRSRGGPIVVKADGLAAGKGVVLAQDVSQAITATDDMLRGAFGKAGRRILVEDYLTGEEASYIVMVDGRHILPFASSQDHKARDDGDRGPNTGGMGAYSPAPVITPEAENRILREVVRPTVAGMAAEGHPYTGFLYAGLMITPGGDPLVLEFNCRLGDPEAQPLLMRLDCDLITLCEAAVDARLDRVEPRWHPHAALGVVMAAQGYPGAYRTGDVIHGLTATPLPGTKVFHAGTRGQNAEVVTAGGRVLCVVALGDDVGVARDHAYQVVKGIDWEGAFYRTDIGYRAIRREAGGRPSSDPF